MRAIRPKLGGRYLVKGMLPSGALTVVWGAPKCGKSFWTLDVVAHIACGLPYRGLKVRQGPVVYIAAEGAEGFEARARAWSTRYLRDADDPPLHVLSRRIDLVHEHQSFIAEIEQQPHLPRQGGRARRLRRLAGRGSYPHVTSPVGIGIVSLPPRQVRRGRPARRSSAPPRRGTGRR